VDGKRRTWLQDFKIEHPRSPKPGERYAPDNVLEVQVNALAERRNRKDTEKQAWIDVHDTVRNFIAGWEGATLSPPITYMPVREIDEKVRARGSGWQYLAFHVRFTYTPLRQDQEPPP